MVLMYPKVFSWVGIEEEKAPASHSSISTAWVKLSMLTTNTHSLFRFWALRGKMTWKECVNIYVLNMYRDDLPLPGAELLVSGAREELPAPTDEYYARTLLYIDRVSPKNILLIIPQKLVPWQKDACVLKNYMSITWEEFIFIIKKLKRN